MTSDPSAIFQKSMILSINDKRLNVLKNKPGEYFVMKVKKIKSIDYHPWLYNFIMDNSPLVVQIRSICILQEGKIGYLLSLKENDPDLIWEVDQKILSEDFALIRDPKDLRFLDHDLL